LLTAARNSKDELPEKINFADLLLLGVATHKLSRIIAKDRVTSPLRARRLRNTSSLPAKAKSRKRCAGAGFSGHSAIC
jgi:hypothetical protein